MGENKPKTFVFFFRDALGRILVEDIIACEPLPPFPASIKDGYAVLSSDKDSKRKVIGAISAGLNVSSIKIQLIKIIVLNIAQYFTLHNFGYTVELLLKKCFNP